MPGGVVWVFEGGGGYCGGRGRRRMHIRLLFRFSQELELTGRHGSGHVAEAAAVEI